MPEQRDAGQEARAIRNTTALLGLANRTLGFRIVEGVNAAGFPNRPAHSAVLANIDVDGGTRLTTLAERANMTPQAMGELVDDLERIGYVARTPDPDDRRAKRIGLTERGRDAVVAALDVIGELERELDAVLGAAEVERLHRSLAAIIGLMRDTGSPAPDRRSNPAASETRRASRPPTSS